MRSRSAKFACVSRADGLGPRAADCGVKGDASGHEIAAGLEQRLLGLLAAGDRGLHVDEGRQTLEVLVASGELGPAG